MINTYPISLNPDVIQEGQERTYNVSKISIDIDATGFTKSLTEGVVKITVVGETPINFNPNGVYVPLESSGATLEALEKLPASVVATALGKPVADVTFADFFQVALAQGITTNDIEGKFNTI